MAGTITVDANGSADFNNIQAAINAAVDGNVVIVADGNYSGECIPSDLNHSQSVDMLDFALLAQDWFLETSWYAP